MAIQFVPLESLTLEDDSPEHATAARRKKDDEDDDDDGHETTTKAQESTFAFVPAAHFGTPLTRFVAP